MNVSSQQHESLTTKPLARWVPLLLALAIVWLATRGLTRLMWTAFAIGWALHWSGGWFPFGF